MSDPAKSTEIEDVLASIRRLVSVDPTGGLKPHRGAVTQKLVLTSDQRVGGDDGRSDRGQRNQAAPLRLEASVSPGLAEVPEDAAAPREDDRGAGKLEIVTESGEVAPDAPASEDVPERDEDVVRDHADEASDESDDAGTRDDKAAEDAPTSEQDSDLALTQSVETFVFNLPDSSEWESEEKIDATEAEDAVRPGSTLEARIAELEAAVSSQASDFEPDGSEDLQQHRPESVPSRRPAPSADTEQAIAQLISDAARSVVTQALDDTGANAEPDAQGSAPDRDTDKSIFNRLRSSPEGASEEDADEGSTEDTAANDDTDARGAIDSSDDADASDDLATAAKDGEAVGEARNADSDVSDPQEASVSEADPEAGKNTDEDGAGRDMDVAEEGAILDEAALRDLVAEIVRSELQGALGERITRNVRKLVRREIMRAITVRDLQ
ncbi:hypothetical protein ILP92_03400 [Maribius pontilimi]|uniref:Uncharacterized protein n=1 Tax=Palleronia pontilimi TaxID=1964209 RepID=A0A934MBJ9_9RHOB|nr:hypothetical protein [Palleronia pontilimi]MBJ3761793.1 hypothetical protein [Palleronia pontilimi]